METEIDRYNWNILQADGAQRAQVNPKIYYSIYYYYYVVTIFRIQNSEFKIQNPRFRIREFVRMRQSLCGSQKKMGRWL